MDKNYVALNMLYEYVVKKEIDFFAVPEQSSKGVNVVLIHAMDFCAIIEENIERGELPSIITIEKGEEFFRVKRLYHAVKMWQGLQRLRKIRIATAYKKVADFPVHKGMKARGFELIVAEAVKAEHVGDNIKEVDVISNIHGRIECKIGGGRLYYSSKE